MLPAGGQIILFILTSVILAIVVGLLMGGKWGNLVTHRFRKSEFVFASILTQVMIFNPVYSQYVNNIFVTRILYILSMVLLLIFVSVNLNTKGIKLLAVGIFANSIAIISNGGHMPASQKGLSSILSHDELVAVLSGSTLNNSILISEQTNFKFLCDIFYIPGLNVFSAGDIFIAVGSFITILYMVIKKNM